MHPNARRCLLETVRVIARQLPPANKLPGGGFSLAGESLDAYDATLKKLIGSGDWSEKFSEKYLAKQLDAAIAQALLDEEHGTNELEADQWIEDLESYSVEKTVYVRVVGVSLPDGPKKIGNVELLEVTDAVCDDLLAAVDGVIATLKNTDEEKAQLREMYRARVLGHLYGKVVAKYRVVAEPDRALERAEDEARRAMDVLRYATPALYPPAHHVAVGLEGDVSRELSWAVIRSSAGVTASYRVKGPLQPFALSEENIERMRQMGALTISAMLAKPDSAVSDFERTILRGVHWFASAQTQPGLENKFLNLIICIETYLTPRDNPIGTAIAEGVAFLLAQGVENRRKLKKRVQEFYRMRSKVSHGGHKAVLEAEVKELQKIALSLTELLIPRSAEWQSQAQLLEWIEEQKLS